MKTTNFIILAAILLLTACKKDNLPLAFVDGQWSDFNWQYGPTASDTDTLTWLFSSSDQSSKLLNVPTNIWGFESNEKAIRNIDENDETSLKGEGLIKYAGSNQEEWVEIVIHKIDEESIRLEYKCPSCANHDVILEKE